MFLLSNFIAAVANILDVVLTILYWLILIRAILSWVNPDPSNPIVRFLNKSTEPILEPIRRIVPFWKMGIDISPIIAFLAILFLRAFAVRTLLDIAVKIH
ncbi:MAG: hypothetical protein COW11_04215 [Candidatus Omnitrophica bacterium CG12_big_fil_rev_8_21_14_0_65_43_15]|uniref:YggT family protein n=1 Tax=Candidatus Taenaricola geysiri TaxID=1974752 RepID=A0A2J0LNE7_9BACT|nr:MAG: hypothetical protein AUJ89_00090 [Candidatus Omnitrophica bacterium CG1_02_43_210]PIR65796.1 MAG: hypothetical protein COU52_02280 [Candidatus Omnitrophica bacterium CG10_big_fil_rev_8_21_14_0_10_43_8]PIV12082.1 MAG: hypothetical protein COS48_02645 [Candidatus Omnitrophica bacterium CG03_land_8_20_14_0_80_43_22]PIW66256.1 MAG: hypothetical protein COW11_04215 [Candidatus Omnitrophica bacterium CG12_big_fil_rev_8_21_14_0_65_43_15]PIW79704.1 MAG: hypothetical protein COZ98_06200 [Candida